MIQQETVIPKKDPEVEYNAILMGFRVAAKVLAVRLFLFLSLIGSFVLSIIATNSQSIQSAYVLVLYALVTTLPLTILEWKRPGGR